MAPKLGIVFRRLYLRSRTLGLRLILTIGNAYTPIRLLLHGLRNQRCMNSQRKARDLRETRLIDTFQESKGSWGKKRLPSLREPHRKRGVNQWRSQKESRGGALLRVAYLVGCSCRAGCLRLGVKGSKWMFYDQWNLFIVNFGPILTAFFL